MRPSSSLADVEVDGDVPADGGVLLSPFDSLLWDKPFVERVFGFAPLIEVYKREHERTYGYYVLPFLLGDRFAGRADLKADRREGVLRVKAFHLEPGVRSVEARGRRVRPRTRAARPGDRARARRAMRIVSADEARRIAVRAQLLDGSATSVLETVRRLGFLQVDPISTVAPPQHVVLWSRLGSRYDPAELDRLLWDEKKLFEWNAYVRPIEDLPLARALMRRRRDKYAHERRGNEFLAQNARAKRHVLRELERSGPLLSREIVDHATRTWTSHGWYGERNVGVMLEILHGRGVVAIVGRRNGQRLWDLAERWYPETETVSLREAERELAERRFRALGVRLAGDRWEAHPDATDGPVPDRATLLSPFDRLIHDRDRAEALWGFRYRLEMYVPKAKREYGYYVLPLLVGDRLVGRAEPRFDRKTATLELLGAWGDTSRVGEVLADLGAWLGAERIATA